MHTVTVSVTDENGLVDQRYTFHMMDSEMVNFYPMMNKRESFTKLLRHFFSRMLNG